MDDLKKLRKKIDTLDKELLKKLAQRFSLTEKIGLYKALNDLSVQDKRREKEMLKARLTLAKKLDLNSNLVKKIFTLIPQTVVKENKKMAKK